MTKFLITLFLGWAGVHKFMEKKIGMGIIYLLTVGLFGFGWLFDIFKAAIELLKSRKKAETAVTSSNFFKVAGTYYKQAEIQSMTNENPDYSNTKKNFAGKKIFKYNYSRKIAALVPEPNNIHDPNAIMVMIDNVHVGYVPADYCEHIKKLLKSKSIKNVEAQIYGGDYKYIDSEGDLVKEKAPLEIKIELM